MIRFTRRSVIKNAALIPRAMGFATELNQYLNKKHDLKLRFGVEMFGGAAMCWYLDAPDFATLEKINNKLVNDGEYWKLLDNAREFWVDGSLQDTVVQIVQ